MGQEVLIKMGLAMWEPKKSFVDDLGDFTIPEKIELGIATDEEIYDYADDIFDRENDK